MSNPSKKFDEGDSARERHALDSERPLALTPLLEFLHGDGYRWASLDAADLDPPTTFPAH